MRIAITVRFKLMDLFYRQCLYYLRWYSIHIRMKALYAMCAHIRLWKTFAQWRQEKLSANVNVRTHARTHTHKHFTMARKIKKMRLELSSDGIFRTYLKACHRRWWLSANQIAVQKMNSVCFLFFSLIENQFVSYKCNGSVESEKKRVMSAETKKNKKG